MICLMSELIIKIRYESVETLLNIEQTFLSVKKGEVRSVDIAMARNELGNKIGEVLTKQIIRNL